MDIGEFAASREERWDRLLDAWNERNTSGGLHNEMSMEDHVRARRALDEAHCAFGMLSAVRLAKELPLEEVEARVRRTVDAKLDALLAQTTQPPPPTAADC